MIHLWGMTLFHLSGINLIFGLGITVDFSVHIAHKYLTIDPPKHLKTREEESKQTIFVLNNIQKKIILENVKSSAFLNIFLNPQILLKDVLRKRGPISQRRVSKNASM